MKIVMFDCCISNLESDTVLPHKIGQTYECICGIVWTKFYTHWVSDR